MAPREANKFLSQLEKLVAKYQDKFGDEAGAACEAGLEDPTWEIAGETVNWEDAANMTAIEKMGQKYGTDYHGGCKLLDEALEADD